MKIRRQKYGSVEVLGPDGPLTDEESEAFIDHMEAELASPNPRIVVDLHDVSFIDSFGIEAMLQFAGELKSRNLPLKLAMLTPTCREILELTDLSREFEIYDEVEDAVRSFV